jgi:hypothetical protein
MADLFEVKIVPRDQRYPTLTMLWPTRDLNGLISTLRGTGVRHETGRVYGSFGTQGEFVFGQDGSVHFEIAANSVSST